MIPYTITHENLLKFLGSLVASGKKLYAPQQHGKKIFFRAVKDPSAIVFDALQTAESPKEVLFPKIEPMVQYRYTAGNVVVEDCAEKLPAVPTVLFGSRPCDAAALATLVEFFKEDVGDPFVEKRAEMLTVVSMSCTQADGYCFCTSVGLTPGDTKGSDILLTPVGNGLYYTEVITEKGKTLIAQAAEYFEKTETIAKEQYLATVPQVFSAEEITKKLKDAFNHPLWEEASLRCIGCGACAYVCPLCSCFDIQDEGTQKCGTRLRCWDSCGFALFTLHTSGHNPRRVQSERWRQRVLHKFSYLPERLHLLGCVGCGRCSRACPADMNLKEQLLTIEQEIVPSR